MSDTLKTVLSSLPDLAANEAKIVRTVMDALFPVPYKPVPKPDFSFLNQPLAATTIKAKRQPKAKTSKSKQSRTDYNEFGKDTSNTRRMWFALRQSSGGVTSKEMAVILGMTENQTAHALSDLWRSPRRRVMIRQSHSNPSGCGRYYSYAIDPTWLAKQPPIPDDMVIR